MIDTNLDSKLETLSGAEEPETPVMGASALAQELMALRQEHKDLQNQLKVHEEYLRYLWIGMDKVRRYIFWNYVGTVIKLLIIVVPLVALYFVAAPMIKQAIQSWQALQTNLNSVNSSINLDSIKEILK